MCICSNIVVVHILPTQILCFWKLLLVLGRREVNSVTVGLVGSNYDQKVTSYNLSQHTDVPCMKW